jgi:dihydrolipoamide dehydrogenase
VIIATGSVPVPLPFLPFDEQRVLSNVGALQIPEVPRHLIVIGGGVIGLELGSVWRRLGARVTVVEFAPTILPGNDHDVIKEADRIFRKQGLTIHTGTKVTGADVRADGVTIHVEKDGVASSLEGDYVLVSVGRKPSLSGVDAAALGLHLGPRGEIVVNDQMRTNLPQVFAIGDVVGGKLLAHKAEDEGVIAAEVIAGKPVHMHDRTMPGVVYTWPEIATVGLTEQDVKASGRGYRVGKFPFSANGKAHGLADPVGFVKVIADAKYGELLGAHLIGPDVSELLPELTLAQKWDLTVDELARNVHTHPTLSEALQECFHGLAGHMINF